MNQRSTATWPSSSIDPPQIAATGVSQAQVFMPRRGTSSGALYRGSEDTLSSTAVVINCHHSFRGRGHFRAPDARPVRTIRRTDYRIIPTPLGRFFIDARSENGVFAPALRATEAKPYCGESAINREPGGVECLPGLVW